MPIDEKGRKIQVRGRQVHMTEVDVARFYADIAEHVPSVRFFDVTHVSDGNIEELSPENPREIASRKRVDMFFPEGPWEPKLEPSGSEWLGMRIADFPRLVASISASSIRRSSRPICGREIRISSDRLFNTNNLESDERGRKIISKLFRLHRKLVDNRTRVIDLRTGQTLHEEKIYDWYGKDMARKCLSEEDLYLQIMVSPETDEFWGYLPVQE